MVEAPAGLLGLANDAWFHYLTDLGPLGPDKGKSGKYGSMEDVDGDGDLDLVVQIPNTIDWAEDATEATLTGETWDGIPIERTDSVRIAPPED